MIIAVLLSTLACGGIGLAYEHDLTEDYAVWATDLRAQAAVVRRDAEGSSASAVVGPMVYAYGWNQDFIIAKQHPNLDGFEEIDESVTRWFIVDVAQDRVYGPLTEDAYTARRRELGMPTGLGFTQTISP